MFWKTMGVIWTVLLMGVLTTLMVGQRQQPTGAVEPSPQPGAPDLPDVQASVLVGGFSAADRAAAPVLMQTPAFGEALLADPRVRSMSPAVRKRLAKDLTKYVRARRVGDEQSTWLAVDASGCPDATVARFLAVAAGGQLRQEFARARKAQAGAELAALEKRHVYLLDTWHRLNAEAMACLGSAVSAEGMDARINAQTLAAEQESRKANAQRAQAEAAWQAHQAAVEAGQINLDPAVQRALDQDATLRAWGTLQAEWQLEAQVGDLVQAAKAVKLIADRIVNRRAEVVKSAVAALGRAKERAMETARVHAVGVHERMAMSKLELRDMARLAGKARELEQKAALTWEQWSRLEQRMAELKALIGDSQEGASMVPGPPGRLRDPGALGESAK